MSTTGPDSLQEQERKPLLLVDDNDNYYKLTKPIGRAANGSDASCLLEPKQLVAVQMVKDGAPPPTISPSCHRGYQKQKLLSLQHSFNK